MILNECYIESFGVIERQSFRFEAGLNCLISDNGTGKSTLAAFIKAMLFGLNTDNKRGLSENDRKKYLPWGGGRYGGSLTLTVKGKRYRIERDFGEKPTGDRFRLFFADTGAPSADYSENIGAEILGIDREGFERTLLLSERMISGDGGINSIRTKLSDLVGVDGDAADSEGAEELLEKKKKSYSRRGRTSEISELDRQLEGLNREISELEDLDVEAREVAAEVAVARQKKRELEVSVEALTDAARAAENAERIARDRAKYEEKKAERDGKAEELGLCDSFFASGIPNISEIADAERALTEAEMLRSSATVSLAREELSELKTFFRRPTSDEEIARMEAAARSLTDLECRADAISRQADADAAEMRRIFPSDAPTEAEIRAAFATKSGKGGAIALTVGLLALVLGTALAFVIHPLTLILAAVGALLIILGAVKSRKTASPEADAMIKAYLSGRYSPEEAQVELLSRRADYDRLSARRDAEAERLGREINETKKLLSGFISEYPSTGFYDLGAAVRYIKKCFDRYTLLLKNEGLSTAERERKLGEAAGREQAAREFLSRYKTETEDPCEEIRERLSKRGELLREVERLDRELSELKAALPDATTPSTPLGREEIAERLAAAREELSAVTKRLALLERREEELIEACDRRPELEGERSEVEEKIKRCEKNGKIIEKTLLYIKMAKEALTDRYLGGTRSAFLAYQKTVSGNEGDFAISSEDLSLTRNDRGGTRELECYSRGTKDLYVLAMHLALADALYKDITPFILLDDPFSALDDGKLERGKTLVRELAKKRQIIYLTPSSSREIK